MVDQELGEDIRDMLNQLNAKRRALAAEVLAMLDSHGKFDSKLVAAKLDKWTDVITIMADITSFCAQNVESAAERENAYGMLVQLQKHQDSINRALGLLKNRQQ